MKKLTAIVLTALFLFSIWGCASQAKTEATVQGTVNQATEPAERQQPKQYLQTILMEQVMGDTTIATTMEYHYDEQGFMSEVLTLSGGEEVGRSTFQCDNKGNPLVETNVSGGITTITESQLTYDDNGILISKIDTVTQEGIVTDVREYHYMENGTGKHSYVRFYRGEDTEPYSAITYEYNDNGQETAQISENNGTVSRAEHTYDDEGRLTKTVHRYGQKEVSTIAEYTYEGEDTVIQSTLDPQGNLLSTATTKEYEEGSTKIKETYMNDTLFSRVTTAYGPLDQE